MIVIHVTLRWFFLSSHVIYMKQDMFVPRISSTMKQDFSFFFIKKIVDIYGGSRSGRHSHHVKNQIL